MVRKIKGVTLYELLIVIVLISVLLLIVIGINFSTQIGKANDLRRKDGLIKLQKVIEDFNVDHGRYPTMEEMAYELMDDTSPNWSDALAGKVCGQKKTSNIMRPYVGELPCDSRSPQEDYVYFIFAHEQKYALFTNLENNTDPAISQIGCLQGCSYFLDELDPAGSVSSHYFNYYLGSSDFSVASCSGSTNLYACYPDRAKLNDRCISCPGGTCQSGYAKLYCNPNWCLDNCH